MAEEREVKITRELFEKFSQKVDFVCKGLKKNLYEQEALQASLIASLKEVTDKEKALEKSEEKEPVTHHIFSPKM